MALVRGVRIVEVEPSLVLRRPDAMLAIPWPSAARCYTEHGADDDELPSLQIWLQGGECLLLSHGTVALEALVPSWG